MLNKAIIVCFILVLLVVIFQSISGKSNNQNNQTYAASWSLANGASSSVVNTNTNLKVNAPNNANDFNSVSNDASSYLGSGSTGVQVSAWTDDSNNINFPSNLPLNAGIPSNLPQTKPPVGLVWQRDLQQYNSQDEFKLWNLSACSAASTASVLAAFGRNVKISDVLAIMEARGGISPQVGLSDYSNFDYVARKFGLQAVLDENRNLDSHFNSMLAQLRANHPLIVNVQDSAYFPNGHFIVAYRLNEDGTVGVMNPDPSPGKSVIQSWPLEGFKLYFSRTMRSVLFTK